MPQLALREDIGAQERPRPTFKPNRKQPEANRLLFGPAQNVLLYGGSRSGKTLVIVRGLVQRCLRASGSRHAIWRKFFNHAAATIGRDTFPKVLRLCFPDLYGKVEFSREGIAIFPNESELWLAGLDDKERVDKILGMEFATNHFNEVSTISFHAVETAHSRLAQKIEIDRDSNFELIPHGQPKFILPTKNWYDMNPVGKRHWSYQAFVKKLRPGTQQPLPDPEDWKYLVMNPDDNAENLADGYIEKTLDAMSEAKRRRFKEGKWAEDNEGSLWKDSALDAARIGGPYIGPDDFALNVEPLIRVVVGVDPSGAGLKRAEFLADESAKPNDIGIVVCGLGASGKGYVLEDATLNAGPADWSEQCVNMFDKWKADLIVAEKNFGGAMVEHTIRTARDTVPVKMVDSSRGKAVRAEPIAALYEPNQRKVKHAGYFDELENQMAAMLPQPIGYTGEGSPDRLDAAVFALTELMLEGAYTLENLD